MSFASLRDHRPAALAVAVAASLIAAPALAGDPPPADLPVIGKPAAPAPQPPPVPQAAPPAAPQMMPQPYPYPYPYPYAYPYPYPYPYGSPAEVPPGMPGSAQVRAVEDYNLPPPPPRERFSTGMWAGGITMVVAGLGMVIGGAGLLSTAANRIDIYCDSPSFPCAHKDDDARKTGGVIVMTAGAIIGAAGIPLWIVGSRFVPLAKAQPGKPARVPEISVGAASLRLRFTF